MLLTTYWRHQTRQMIWVIHVLQAIWMDRMAWSKVTEHTIPYEQKFQKSARDCRVFYAISADLWGRQA